MEMQSAELPVSRILSSNAKYSSVAILNWRMARHKDDCTAVSDIRSDTGADMRKTQSLK